MIDGNVDADGNVIPPTTLGVKTDVDDWRKGAVE